MDDHRAQTSAYGLGAHYARHDLQRMTTRLRISLLMESDTASRRLLLLPCGDCQGRGEYVGLLERKTCPTCGGRKVVPV